MERAKCAEVPEPRGKGVGGAGVLVKLQQSAVQNEAAVAGGSAVTPGKGGCPPFWHVLCYARQEICRAVQDEQVAAQNPKDWI